MHAGIGLPYRINDLSARGRGGERLQCAIVGIIDVALAVNRENRVGVDGVPPDSVLALSCDCWVHSVRKADLACKFDERAAHKLHGLESKPGNALHGGALRSPTIALPLLPVVGSSIAWHGVLCGTRSVSPYIQFGRFLAKLLR